MFLGDWVIDAGESRNHSWISWKWKAGARTRFYYSNENTFFSSRLCCTWCFHTLHILAKGIHDFLSRIEEKNLSVWNNVFTQPDYDFKLGRLSLTSCYRKTWEERDEPEYSNSGVAFNRSLPLKSFLKQLDRHLYWMKNHLPILIMLLILKGY